LLGNYGSLLFPSRSRVLQVRKDDGLQHKGEGMPFLPFRMAHTVMAQDMLTHRYTTKNIT
jgi:hypothetical protein